MKQIGIEQILFVFCSSRSWSRSMMLIVFLAISVLLPACAQSNCCRLPFTDSPCTVNRNGPHRYRVMPDQRSGLVTESTECFINDFDSAYRKLNKTENCNDCPGLLILRTNSSEIFLFPEYLERILEDRPLLQRKNLVILTTSLRGAYDVNFIYFSRFYKSYPAERIPSLYIDLELPGFNPKQEIQPSLRLRFPSYSDTDESFFRINREDLMSNYDPNDRSARGPLPLPFIYHFDHAKHSEEPTTCRMYNITVTPAGLQWKRLDSPGAACSTFMPFFGRNPCLATGFNRLFCPITENIESTDSLILSPYIAGENRVERLTLAVVGQDRIEMQLSNQQLRIAEQVKILLIKGHLVYNDVNNDRFIRVEYGWNCSMYSLVVRSGGTSTFYRRFDGEHSVPRDANGEIALPPCFRLNLARPPAVDTAEEIFAFKNLNESNGLITGMDTSFESNKTDLNEHSPYLVDNENTVRDHFWEEILVGTDWIWIILLFCGLAAIVCLGIFLLCCLCCTRKRRSSWTLKQPAQTNPAFEKEQEKRVDQTAVRLSTEATTQTKDQPLRI